MTDLFKAGRVGKLFVFVSLGLLAPTALQAGGRDWDNMRRSGEQAQEQMRQQQQQASERARQFDQKGKDSVSSGFTSSGGSGNSGSAGGSGSNASGGGAVASGGSGSSGDQASTGGATSAKAGDTTSAINPKEKSKDTSSRGSKDDDDKVPGTIAEWLQNLQKSSSKSSDSHNHSSSGTAGGTIAPSGNAVRPPVVPAAKVIPAGAPPAASPGRRPNVPNLMVLPLPRPEVLVRKLTLDALEKLQRQGFQPNGTADVSGAGLHLTRLIVPESMTAETARVFLEQSLDPNDVGVNQKYRIFKTATGIQSSLPTEAPHAPRSMATPCGSDRCFGAAAINWSAQLQECARSLRVGIVDTGYDATHSVFKARAIEARPVLDKSRSRAPDWHGTGVLALLGGDPRSPHPGLIPDAKFFLADIFYADADGQPASDTASLLNALDWLDKKRVNVVNLSLAGPHDAFLENAILELSKKGVMFVAAVGNEGPVAPPSYPAAYAPVIAVTAVGADLKSYRYASRGAHVEFAAPGVDIWTAVPGGKSGYHSGTSFAAPFVTAVLASLYRDMPKKTKDEFRKLVSTADLGASGPDPIYGRGLLIAPASCRAPAVAGRPATSEATQVSFPASVVPGVKRAETR